MLDASELVRLVVNKMVVPEKREGGRKGYGRCPAVRLLVYAQLKGIHRDKNLEKYLEKNRGIAIALGLDGVPDRTTIGRWKRRLKDTVGQAFEKISNIVRMLSPTEDLIVDSTPLEGQKGPEAKWGKYSHG